MTERSPEMNLAAVERRNPMPSRRRFGGVLWRVSRLTKRLTLPLAGKRWNPIFAVVEHRGRRTGRQYATPVAARRIAGGFAITLAFGAQVDWYRNLLAAGGGVIRWRAHAYRVAAPEPIAATAALAAFDPVQRLFLRIGGIDGYVQVRDLDSGDQ
jgi:deazaflavin-dependent oxidoreductase (nitroreductase family)